MEVDFKTLVGEKASLYYTNMANYFQLGSVVFEVIEDENDGYRSAMKEVKIHGNNVPKVGFLAEVEIKELNTEVSGFELVDTKDCHCWLQFGTNYTDDYYPCFVFNWTPKTPENDLKTKIK